MTIEIYAPHDEVPEHIIEYVKDNLMGFYHRDNEITGAEVVLRKQDVPAADKYVCEITLAIYGELLMVHRCAENYLPAAREVLKELSLKVDEFLIRQKEPPDEITSTVKV
jgi:ribosome-associated translation inhibitor RaiA